MTLPCTDIQLEQRYLATLLQAPDPEHFASSLRLSPLDCAKLQHGKILEAMHVLAAAGEMVCEPAIQTALDRAGAKQASEAIRELASASISFGLLDSMADRLRRLSAARRRRETLLLAARALEDGRDEAADEHIQSLGVESGLPERVKLMSLADAAASAVTAFVESPDRSKWRTGFPILDAAIGGMVPGTMLTIGGRTGAGKSSVALAIAMHQARNRLKPGIVSVEDADTVWGPRGLAHVCAINSESFYTGKFGDGYDTEHELKKGDEALKKTGIEMAFALGAPLRDVLTAIRALVLKGCNSIIVDYAQVIQPDDARMDRAEFVSHAANKCKRECQVHNVSFTLLSQLARPQRGNPFSEPHITDLKESGDLENISDVIMLLWSTGDTDSSLKLGKIAKVKWSPKRPRFEVWRGRTGAVETLQEAKDKASGMPNDAGWGQP